MRIRYYGHVGKRTGYGIAGEHLCNALLRTPGVELLVMPFVGFDRAYLDSLPLTRHLCGGATRDYVADHEIAIVHDLPVDVAAKGRALREGRALAVEHARAPGVPMQALIAYTTWEADTMPRDVAQPLAVFDQVWMPSEHNANLLNRMFDSHVNTWAKGDADRTAVAVPHPFDPATTIERIPRARYTFTWWGACTARKNPLGVVRAFCHAFTPEDDVELVIHSSGLTEDLARAMLGATGLEQAAMPKIRFSNGHKPLTELVGDCYVSASRGEAWNLPAFEAGIIAGAHVIVPEGQGSDDYLLPTSADFVVTHPQPAVVDAVVGADGRVMTSGAQGLTGRATWGEPSLVNLSGRMRAAHAATKRTLAIGYDPVATYGYEAVGARMKKLLDQYA